VRGPFSLDQLEEHLGDYTHVLLDLEPSAAFGPPWNAGRTVGFWWECGCSARGTEAASAWSACNEHQVLTVDAPTLAPGDVYNGGFWVTRELATSTNGKGKMFRIDVRDGNLVVVAQPL
jgi:hypothetical protein